jgi:hypothetical protein
MVISWGSMGMIGENREDTSICSCNWERAKFPLQQMMFCPHFYGYFQDQGRLGKPFWNKKWMSGGPGHDRWETTTNSWLWGWKNVLCDAMVFKRGGWAKSTMNRLIFPVSHYLKILYGGISSYHVWASGVKNRLYFYCFLLMHMRTILILWGGVGWGVLTFM